MSRQAIYAVMNKSITQAYGSTTVSNLLKAEDPQLIEYVKGDLVRNVAEFLSKDPVASRSVTIATNSDFPDTTKYTIKIQVVTDFDMLFRDIEALVNKANRTGYKDGYNDAIKEMIEKSTAKIDEEV